MSLAAAAAPPSDVCDAAIMCKLYFQKDLVVFLAHVSCARRNTTFGSTDIELMLQSQ